MTRYTLGQGGISDQPMVADRIWDVLVDQDVPLLYRGHSEELSSHIGLLWGRGVGWALLGLVDMLVDLP